MKPRNRHPGQCERCGKRVAPGEGFLERHEDAGAWRTAVEHETCPGEGAPALPTWAVPANGRTPAGNPAKGYSQARGHARPHPDAVPLCDAARAIAAREGRN